MSEELLACVLLVLLLGSVIIVGIILTRINLTDLDLCMRRYHDYEYCQMKVGASE